MKRLIILSLIVLPLFCFSQTRQPAELSFLKGANLFNKKGFVIAAQHSFKDISLAIFSKRGVYCAVMDTAFTVKDFFLRKHDYATSSFADLDKEPIAALYDGKKACYLMHSLETVSLYEADYEEKTFYLTENIAFSGRELFLGATVYQNVFHIYAVRPKAKTLKIYVKEIGKPIISQEYSFSSPDSSLKEEFFEELYKSSLIISKKKTTLNHASKKIKFYPETNKVKCIYDSKNGNTVLLTFRSGQSIPGTSVVRHDLKGCKKINPDHFKFNSFLLEDQLYQVNVCTDRILISIKYAKDGALTRDFVVSTDKDFKFGNSPIIQEGSSFWRSSSRTRELNDLKDLVRKMLDGNPVITAAYADSSVLLTIGSFKELKSAGYSGGRWMGGGSFSTPGGSVTLPAYYVPGGYSGWKTSTKSAYFKSVLIPGSLLHDSMAKAAPHVYDRIDEYVDKYAIVDYTVFNFVSTQVLFYYDELERKYFFITFYL